MRDKNNINITNKIKCLKSLKISINSILCLWKDLNVNAQFDYLLTRRLNQDMLENYFGKIRQQNGNCINPTAIQFKRSFRKLLCLNLFHSGTENCEADVDEMLLKLYDIPQMEEPLTIFSENEKNVQRINDIDCQKDDVLEKKNYKIYMWLFT